LEVIIAEVGLQAVKNNTKKKRDAIRFKRVDFWQI
jgi:hypothetical protein